MVLVRIVALVMLALVAATASALAAPADSLMAPSEPPVALPWKIGQSVTYEVTGRNQAATISLRVVAEDACGFWVDYDDGDGATHRACVGRPPNPQLQLVATRKGGLVTSVDTAPTKVGTADMLLARWNGRRGIPREDVTTPAGTFPAALKEVAAGGPRWSHPAVPLGGLVRATMGDVTAVLVEYTVTGGSSVISADQRSLLFHAAQERVRSRPQRFWMSLAFGNDLLGTLDDKDWTSSFGVGLGYRLTKRIALVGEMVVTGAAPYPAKPELTETLTQAVAGLRWFPLVDSTGRWSALAQPVYLQFDAGFAQLDRESAAMTVSTVGRGVMGGVCLGTSTMVKRDWRGSVEVHQHTAVLNGDEGIRVTLGIRAIIELYW